MVIMVDHSVSVELATEMSEGGTRVPSAGFRGIPWGALLILTLLYAPVYVLSLASYSPSFRPVAAVLFASTWVALVLVLTAFAPRWVSLREDGLEVRFWWGTRFIEWENLQPSRRCYTFWSGYALNQQMDDGTWRHYFLTREQARLAMAFPSFRRRSEASLEVRNSLGVPTSEAGRSA